jgi:chemotaxis signal transduction protein
MSVVNQTDRASFVLLHVGKSRYALPSRAIVELAPPVRLHTFPHASKHVAGVIVRRGRIVPVYDGAPLLTGRESPLHRFYLVAEVGHGAEREPSAIPVTGECELASGDLQPRADDDPDYFTGKLLFGDQQVDVLNLESLVAAAAQAKQAASAAASMEGARV